MGRIVFTNYLEFHDEAVNSHKFYRVKFYEDGMATIEWGRIGAAGQSQDKSWGEAEAKLNEKRAKGYEDKTEDDGTPIDPFKVRRRHQSEAKARVEQKREERRARAAWVDDLDLIARAK